MTEKTFLWKKEIEGNIRDYKQIVEILYYPKTEEFPSDKIAVYTYLEDPTKPIEEQRLAKRSIYFKFETELKEFIVALSKAYFYFKEQKKEINPENFNYHLSRFLNEVEKEIRGWEIKNSGEL